MKANYSMRGYQVYGDIENVKTDAKTINDIIQRQGVDILLECLADYVGNCAVKFKLSEKEKTALKLSVELSLLELIGERL